MLLLFLCLSCLPIISSLKILAYSPVAYHSHANFLSKIADVLSEAGHEVVILSPVLHLTLPRKISKHARYIYYEENVVANEFTEYVDKSLTHDLWTADNSGTAAFAEKLRVMYGLQARMCRALTADKVVLQQLKHENFDVGFGESLDICAFAIFNLVGITKYAVTESLPAIDGLGHVTGVPLFTSYVPGMVSSYSDRMTLRERAWNTVGALWMKYSWVSLMAPNEADLRAAHPTLPSFGELLGRCSYFFVNTEPLIDFPRLVTRKIIDIGGISVPEKHNSLAEPFSSWLSERPQTVLVSFGTMMHSSRMPAHFKASILETAKRLQNVTFIWKYEREEDNIAAGILNLHTTPWVPQTDMLHDPRLSIFVTHGGLGSVNEATFTGVPLVVLPVMADQMRNGQMVKRLGTGLLLHRDDLGSPSKIEAAIREVLEAKKYRVRAKTVSAMLAAQPQPVRERLVSHFEFMAAFGPLDSLDQAGRDLTFIEFFNLDIAAIFFLGVVLIAVVFAFIVLAFSKFISRTIGRVYIVKSKRE